MGLFRPKWMKDPAETSRLTDPEKLKKAYLDSGNGYVAYAAAMRIEDQSVLAEGLIKRVALYIPNGLNSSEAETQVMERVTDKQLRIELARAGRYVNKNALIQALTDDDVLAAIATGPYSRYETLPACDRIQSQEALARVVAAVRDHPDDSSGRNERLCAVLERVTDDALLADIATSANVDVKAQGIAAGRIQSQDALSRVYRNAPKEETRQAALRRITDQALLLDAAEHATNALTRTTAIENLTDLDALRRLQAQSPSDSVRASALSRMIKLKDAEGLGALFDALSNVDKRRVAPILQATGNARGEAWLAEWREEADDRRKRLAELRERNAARQAEAAAKIATEKAAARPAGPYNALQGREAADYVNALSPRELMELILLGEDGKPAQNHIWLCSRLAEKMMIPVETGDRATIEMFFLAFSGATARGQYRRMTGFWDPSQASATFTQVMLQFAGLPQSIRDMHARLYLEEYGRM